MEKSDYVVLFDADDVLWDLLTPWVKELNKISKYQHNQEDIKQWNLKDSYPDLTEDQICSFLFDYRLWNNVKINTSVAKAVKKLYVLGFNVYICSNTCYRTAKYKYEKLISKYYPFIDENHIIWCSNKQLIKGNILIDDAVHNLIGGSYHKVLFNRPHNENFDVNSVKDTIIRVNNGIDISHIVQYLYNIDKENSI